MPFVKKTKDKILFVNAFLLPQEQLIELICFLTGCNKIETKLPQRFSYRQPLRLMTPRGSFYNCLTKVSPFEQLDVLCLTYDMEDYKSSMHVNQQALIMRNVAPPKALMNGLFKAYTQVFTKDETEHTILYYLYRLEQIQKSYTLMDLVQVVAMDLIEDIRKRKQDEPTIVEEQNMSIGHINGNQTPSPFPNQDQASPILSHRS